MPVSKGSAEQACLHKRTYRTRAMAERAAKASQSVLGARMEAYRCLHCRCGWHIGHARDAK